MAHQPFGAISRAFLSVLSLNRHNLLYNVRTNCRYYCRSRLGKDLQLKNKQRAGHYIRIVC